MVELVGQTCAQPVPLNHQSVPSIEDLQGVGEVGVGRVLHIEQLVSPARVGVVKLEEAGDVVHLEVGHPRAQRRGGHQLNTDFIKTKLRDI